MSPLAPNEVKDAWNRAEKVSGINGYGVDSGGKLASYIARQAPGYAGSYVQQKEHNSRAGFQEIWNGTY